MKNTALTNIWNKEIHRFKITNSLMIFFLSVAATYQIHFWTNGIINKIVNNSAYQSNPIPFFIIK